MVPAKHRVDSVREFGVVLLVDTTGVNPKVLQAILSSLFSTEPDLLISKLFLASTIYHILEGSLLVIRSPCVRKYGIRRDWILDYRWLDTGPGVIKRTD